jgi:transcription initiation protein SPT3
VRIDKLAAKAQKITIKLPWEVTTIYSEAVKQSGHQSDDEEDEDDLEAQEASLERLKVTSHLTPLIHIFVLRRNVRKRTMSQSR